MMQPIARWRLTTSNNRPQLQPPLPPPPSAYPIFTLILRSVGSTIWIPSSPSKHHSVDHEFHWAVAKLPFSLTPAIRPLTRDPTAIADPYKKLKDLILESYGMTDEQRTNKWLDYPMCDSATRPSVLWDNLHC
jgi:hypothetical protein